MGCPKHAFIPVRVYFSIFGRHLAPPRASYIALIVLPTFLCLVSPRVTSLCVETAVAKCVSMETSRIWAMITSHSLVTSLFYDVTHPILLFPTEVYMGTPSSGALLRELWDQVLAEKPPRPDVEAITRCNQLLRRPFPPFHDQAFHSETSNIASYLSRRRIERLIQEESTPVTP